MPVSLLGPVISGFLNYLKNQNLENSIRGAYALIQSVSSAVNAVLMVILRVKQQEAGAWKYVQPLARDVGDELASMADDTQFVTERIVDTILPRSLAFLNGYIFSHGIVPLRNQVRSIEGEIGKLSGRVSVLEIWRKTYADPHIMDWRRFNSYFNTWPVDVLNTWHSWFGNPHLFGQWAAAPVVGPIVSYLAEADHQQTRDNLSLIMTDAWSEAPNATWENILQWLVTSS